MIVNKLYFLISVKEPQPIPCPIGGRFSFGQKGSVKLAPKILGGVTKSPLDTYKCFNYVADISICDSERKWIIIDTDLCITLNQDGRPVDSNSEFELHYITNVIFENKDENFLTISSMRNIRIFLFNLFPNALIIIIIDMF